MALESPLTQVGAKLYIVAQAPATFDQSGCEALASSPGYTQIKRVITIPPKGDASEEGTVVDLEEGRELPYPGVKRVASFDVPFVFSETDPGQVIVRAAANTTTEHTLKQVENDGMVKYIVGTIGPVMDDEVAPGTHKGQYFTFRPLTTQLVIASP